MSYLAGFFGCACNDRETIRFFEGQAYAVGLRMTGKNSKILRGKAYAVRLIMTEKNSKILRGEGLCCEAQNDKKGVIAWILGN